MHIHRIESDIKWETIYTYENRIYRRYGSEERGYRETSWEIYYETICEDLLHGAIYGGEMIVDMWGNLSYYFNQTYYGINIITTPELEAVYWEGNI